MRISVSMAKFKLRPASHTVGYQTVGSVSAKAATCSPVASLGRYFFFCCSLPFSRMPADAMSADHEMRAHALEANTLMRQQRDGDGCVAADFLRNAGVRRVGQAQTCQQWKY